MVRERRAGMIINIASSSAKANYPFAGAYGSSKWAVAGLTEALALELAPFNILRGRRDAAFLVLMKRLLPQVAFKRMQASSILRPPSPLALRFLSWVMGGTERVEVDRGSISPAA